MPAKREPNCTVTAHVPLLGRRILELRRRAEALPSNSHMELYQPSDVSADEDEDRDYDV